ncbi:MAG TPA: hypothetical protein VMX74_03215 [Pirellulales bacterium]|nr:hypothetical protein [Pirellulales bacterium]
MNNHDAWMHQRCIFYVWGWADDCESPGELWDRICRRYPATAHQVGRERVEEIFLRDQQDSLAVWLERRRLGLRCTPTRNIARLVESQPQPKHGCTTRRDALTASGV